MISSERTGLLYALAGFASLSVGDAMIKALSGQWPPTAIAFLRFLMAFIWLGLALYQREGRAALALPHPRIQWLRGAAVAFASTFFFAAVALMPLAEAVAIGFTSPMFVALLAAAMLGEPARRSTWVASLVALAGVLIILRPNFLELGWAAPLPLGSAFCFAFLLIGNRLAAGKGSALAMQFYVAATATPILLVVTIAGHFSGLKQLEVQVPPLAVVAVCAFVSVSASIAHGLIYLGTTRAGAALVAPMSYVQLLSAGLLGVVMFGDVPDATALLGAAIIVTAGLYLWRASSAVALDPALHLR